MLLYAYINMTGFLLTNCIPLSNVHYWLKSVSCSTVVTPSCGIFLTTVIRAFLLIFVLVTIVIFHNLCFIKSEAVTANKLTKISGNQLWQCWIKNQCFRDLGLHLLGSCLFLLLQNNVCIFEIYLLPEYIVWWRFKVFLQFI